MNSLFTFSGEVPNSKFSLEALFLFSPVTPEPHSVDNSLTNFTQTNRISPDLIVFITAKTKAKKLEDVIQSSHVTQRLERFSRCKGILLCPFDENGEPTDPVWIKHPSIAGLTIGSIFKAARKNGLAHLARADGVITYAPHGAYFRNPSQGPRSFFMRAGLMCRNSTEATFVALALLPVICTAKKLYKQSPNIFFIDTVSIAHIAYALLDLSRELNVLENPPEIRSFSSYDRYAKISLGGNDFPIFIISASTSGGLEKLILKSHNGTVDKSVISTILTAYEEKFPRSLYVLPDKERGPSITSISAETLREITISGEDFLFKPSEPKSVELKRTQQAKNFRKSFTQKIQGKGLIYCFKKTRSDRPIKAFLIDGNKLVKHAGFRNWVRKKSIGSLPATVKRIVYQDDLASREMATIVRRAITPHCKVPPKVTSATDLITLKPQKDETVVVVAAVAGSGMALMSVTKALRGFQPEGSRYFLVGIVLGRTYSQLRQLNSNLKISDENLTYAVETWGEFAASHDAVMQYWDREKRLLNRIIDKCKNSGVDATTFESRLKIISSSGIIHGKSQTENLYWALNEKNKKAFEIGDGFALWEKGYAVKECQSDILFTVACWLQNARESKDIPLIDRLEGGGFGQTIITPDFLIRFTDPVIQASILRCANDSELDYRCSSTISARAADILEKFCSIGEESILELLVGIAVERLRFKKKDLDRITSAARKGCSTDIRVKYLLKAIKELAD